MNIAIKVWIKLRCLTSTIYEIKNECRQGDRIPTNNEIKEVWQHCESLAECYSGYEYNFKYSENDMDLAKHIFNIIN